ncbi:MAG: cytochrome c-type biogenesis protein CcmH, partial [Anaerolineae bacterium]|nr:cytochrome c-type biogenesis protein CcmH [Anaerolineae bacterium]
MKTPKLLTLIVLLLFLPVLSLPGQVCAQEDGVTFDQVNAIAEKLYCPVCPNETLEDCQTQACAQWRAEIAEQLAEGQTEQQVIDAFVRRYGERVVAIPQDPGLRALSVLTPYLLGGLALIVGT